MLDKEFNYFKENQSSLYEIYPNKYLVIIGESIEGNFDSFEDAISFASSKFKIGTFLVQSCTSGEEAYTQKFHSRVIFA